MWNIGDGVACWLAAVGEVTGTATVVLMVVSMHVLSSLHSGDIRAIGARGTLPRIVDAFANVGEAAIVKMKARLNSKYFGFLRRMLSVLEWHLF